jgi:hypothetical protein
MVCARGGDEPRVGGQAVAAAGFAQRRVLASQQHQQPRVIDVRERVVGVERQGTAERLLR